MGSECDVTQTESTVSDRKHSPTRIGRGQGEGNQDVFQCSFYLKNLGIDFLLIISNLVQLR